MSVAPDFRRQCPLPLVDYPEIVLAHGGGGAATQRLIEQIFLPAFDNPFLLARHDGASLTRPLGRLAFTTDSYVVRPWFFPGGDIGSMAIHGTVNDLAMCGARPQYLSAGFILEEGFKTVDLIRIVASMRFAADTAGVQIVTGDTKVVDKGSGDGIFINTSGIGTIIDGAEVAPANVAEGDVVILSGDIGRHGVAVMAAREGLNFETDIQSDSTSLIEPVVALLEAGIQVHCLRDATRGGVVSALVEIAQVAGVKISIDESAVPVTDGVRGACEILGFDPLYIANEGRFVAFVAPADQRRAVQLLRRFESCAQAGVIGRVITGGGIVCAKTALGGERVLDMLSGEQLPRIC